MNESGIDSFRFSPELLADKAMTANLNGILEKLALTINGSNDLEQLVRPFLEILEDITGLESTYLTHIDQAQGLQHILYANNTKTQ